MVSLTLCQELKNLRVWVLTSFQWSQFRPGPEWVNVPGAVGRRECQEVLLKGVEEV